MVIQPNTLQGHSSQLWNFIYTPPQVPVCGLPLFHFHPPGLLHSRHTSFLLFFNRLILFWPQELCVWYSLPRTLLPRILSKPGFFKSGLIKGPPSQSILQSSSSPLPHHYHFDLCFLFLELTPSPNRFLVYYLSVSCGPDCVSRAVLFRSL